MSKIRLLFGALVVALLAVLAVELRAPKQAAPAPMLGAVANASGVFNPNYQGALTVLGYDGEPQCGGQVCFDGGSWYPDAGGQQPKALFLTGGTCTSTGTADVTFDFLGQSGLPGQTQYRITAAPCSQPLPFLVNRLSQSDAGVLENVLY
jgi:hypothetical protein